MQAGAAARRPGWPGRSALGAIRGGLAVRTAADAPVPSTDRALRLVPAGEPGRLPGRADRPARRAGQAAGRGHDRVEVEVLYGTLAATHRTGADA